MVYFPPVISVHHVDFTVLKTRAPLSLTAQVRLKEILG